MKKIKRLISITLLVPLMMVLMPFSNAGAVGDCVQPQVAAGGHHTIGLKMDGTVVSVGWNNYGQRNVGGWSDIAQVATGYYHTVGIKKNGDLVATGNNAHGQCDVTGWSNIIQVAPGYHHTIGLKTDGKVVAEGNNHYGQCNVSGWTNIIQVSAGKAVYTSFTVGVQSDGKVVATGDNSKGQCNVSGWSNIVQAAAGFEHTVGLKPDGTVVAVGDNSYGKCNVSGWSNIIQVAAGDDHTIGLKADGKVVSAGSNSLGQRNVSGWSNIVQVTAGDDFTVGLKSDGRVVATGLNWKGQCNVGSWDLLPTYEDGFQAGYADGYQDGLNYCSPIIAGLEEQLEALMATYLDVTPPAGSVHAHDNLLWSPNNKMVEVTLSGYVRDELSMARDGGGTGVSSAHLLINGIETIPLVLDANGEFSVDKEFKASKGTTYTIELYAADTNPEDQGGPNNGLVVVDQTYIRVPLNLGGKE